MSKRSEKAALAAYPVSKISRDDWIEYKVYRGDDENRSSRKTYKEGYEAAEEDIIARAKEWMFHNASLGWGYREKWAAFEKAMREG